MQLRGFQKYYQVIYLSIYIGDYNVYFNEESIYGLTDKWSKQQQQKQEIFHPGNNSKTILWTLMTGVKCLSLDGVTFSAQWSLNCVDCCGLMQIKLLVDCVTLRWLHWRGVYLTMAVKMNPSYTLWQC